MKHVKHSITDLLPYELAMQLSFVLGHQNLSFYRFFHRYVKEKARPRAVVRHIDGTTDRLDFVHGDSVLACFSVPRFHPGAYEFAASWNNDPFSYYNATRRGLDTTETTFTQLSIYED